MRKQLIILSLVLLTSCEYDYIFDNPNHPQEYFGNWINVKTTINGMKIDSVNNFLILQDGVTVNKRKFANWKVDGSNIVIFTLLNNTTLKPEMVYEVQKEPYFEEMELKYNNVVFYLVKN